MQNPALLDYTISEEEVKQIQSNLPSLSKDAYSEASALTWLDQPQSTKIIPEVVRSKIKEFKTGTDKFGAMCLHNLPVEDIATGYSKDTSNSEILLLSISKLLGKPVGCATKYHGIVISNVIPKKEDAYEQVGTGAVELIFHTEDAQLEYNCDFVVLLCLRGDKDANTTLCFIDENQLRAEILNELYQKNFIISSDVTFEKSDSITTGVLSKSDDRLLVRYDPVYSEYKTPEAHAAIDELTEYITQSKFAVNLQRGDLLIINNRNSVHGRSEFKPRYDGADRWVQRTTVVTKAIPETMLVPEHPYVMNV